MIRSPGPPTFEAITGRVNIHASEITTPKISHQVEGTIHQSKRAMRRGSWSTE